MTATLMDAPMHVYIIRLGLNVWCFWKDMHSKYAFTR